MQLGRRRFLRTVGLTALVGAGGVLAACQAPGATAPTAAPPPASATTPAPAAVAPRTPTGAPASAPTTAVAATSAPTTAAVATRAPTTAPAATPNTAGRAPTAGKPMYQQDAQHTGRSPYAGPQRQPRLVRRFDTGLPANLPADPVTPRADFQSSSAIGPDGTIYVANFPGVLWAVRDSASASDALEVAWRFHPPAASSFHATPAVSADGSTVYLGFAAGGFQAPGRATFYALKAPAEHGGDADVAWSVDLGMVRVMASPTVGPDGTIYVGTSGGLVAIGSDGSTRWTAPTGPAIKSAPAVGTDGTLYHASSDGKMYAVSPQGQVKWTFDFGEHLGPTPLMVSQATGPGGGGGGANGVGSGASPTVGPDGTIFIGANNSNFYAVTPNGEMKWLFEAERELAGIWTTAVLSADAATLYFGANKGGLYALDAASGSKRWQFPVYGSIFASSVLDTRGVLYTGTTVEHVYAVNAASGEQVWDYDAHSQVWSAPSLRPDGTLVIADRGGIIQVLA